MNYPFFFAQKGPKQRKLPKPFRAKKLRAKKTSKLRAKKGENHRDFRPVLVNFRALVNFPLLYVDDQILIVNIRGTRDFRGKVAGDLNVVVDLEGVGLVGRGARGAHLEELGFSV